MRSLFAGALGVYSRRMAQSFVYNFAALAALLPAALVAAKRGAERGGLFWALIALAAAGPTLWSAALLADSWHSDLSVTLWVGIAVTMLLFAATAVLRDQAARLAPLLLPYLLVLGLLATLARPQETVGLLGTAPSLWIQLHIGMGVVTYGLLTLAAVAALAGFLQERALKAKRATPLTRQLPSVADSEILSNRLLVASVAVLGAGLVSGSVIQFFEAGVPLVVDHKTVLSIAAFVVIGALVAGQRVCGVRGRMAARMVLLAYLLVTFAYPGVKFVREVLLR